MTDKTLLVLLSGEKLGTLTEDRFGKHRFTYSLEGPDRHLSLSMPKRTSPWGPDRVEPFLDGLLPENHGARAAIARRYDAVAGNTFSLLAAIGRDCAGAIQFLDPDAPGPIDQGGLTPLSDAEIGERLHQLISTRQPSWHVHDDHWSLAGAQEKFALHRRGDHWYQATGSTPTTHIIKPGITDLRCQPYNEVLCQTTLRELGLPAAGTDYADFAGIPALVSRRWDRHVAADGTVARIHQEDLCQALAISPANKYQAEGGPSPADIITLLRSLHLDDDIWIFTRALVVNLLLGATDAHGKNYALLYPADGPPRLAPLYDVASVLPYSPAPRSRKLAMKIGSRYAYDEITLRHWIAFAEANALDSDLLSAQIYFDATELPDAVRIAIEHHPPRTEDERLLATSLLIATQDQCRRVLGWFA